MDFYLGRGEFRLRQEQSCHRAGHAPFTEEPRLMLRNRESGVRKAHAALEEKAAKRIRPAKTTVDFGVQRTDEDESEGRQLRAVGTVCKARPSIHRQRRNRAAPPAERGSGGAKRAARRRGVRYRSAPPVRIRTPSQTIPSL